LMNIGCALFDLSPHATLARRNLSLARLPNAFSHHPCNERPILRNS
jgi:hypothetical protein